MRRAGLLLSSSPILLIHTRLNCLLATDNVRSITYNFQKIQFFTLDVQQFEHN